MPLYNEEESLGELVAWIDRVARENSLTYEVIMVDDGSADGSWEVVKSLAKQNPAVKGVSFRRNYGKSAALYAGFEMATGEVVFTMDADLQDSPDEIPEMRRMILEEGYDLVSGWKRKRYDPISKRLPSKFFNFTVRMMSGIRLHDFNCGLKAYRLKVVKSVEVYGEMHRYMPLLAKHAGFKRIGEKVVEHHERKYGYSKFGIERMLKGYLDLISVTFHSHFGRSPMYLFGGRKHRRKPCNTLFTYSDFAFKRSCHFCHRSSSTESIKRIGSTRNIFKNFKRCRSRKGKRTSIH